MLWIETLLYCRCAGRGYNSRSTMHTSSQNHSALRMLLAAAVLLSALVGRPLDGAPERESAAAEKSPRAGSVVSLRDTSALAATIQPAGTLLVLAALHDLPVPAPPGCVSDATSAAPQKSHMCRRDARRPSGSGSPSLISLRIRLQV